MAFHRTTSVSAGSSRTGLLLGTSWNGWFPSAACCGLAFLRSYWIARQIVEDALLVMAGHFELPPEANPRIGNVYYAFLWERCGADASQTRQFGGYGWPIERRSWRRAVSQVSVNYPTASDWPHYHVGRAISLRLRQDFQEGSLKMNCRTFVHGLPLGE